MSSDNAPPAANRLTQLTQLLTAEGAIYLIDVIAKLREHGLPNCTPEQMTEYEDTLYTFLAMLPSTQIQSATDYPFQQQLLEAIIVVVVWAWERNDAVKFLNDPTSASRALATWLKKEFENAGAKHVIEFQVDADPPISLMAQRTDGTTIADLFLAAKQENDQLKARIAELEGTLLPFGKLGQVANEPFAAVHIGDDAEMICRAGACRQAATVLKLGPLPEKEV